MLPPLLPTHPTFAPRSVKERFGPATSLPLYCAFFLVGHVCIAAADAAAALLCLTVAVAA